MNRVLIVLTVLSCLTVGSARAEFFNGDRLVDRHQAAIVFSRILWDSGQFPEGLSTRHLPYSDVPSFYERSVGTVTALGIIPAHEDKFNGRAFVTRYQMGRWVYRMLERVRVDGLGTHQPRTPIDIPIADRDRKTAIETTWRHIMPPRDRHFNGKHYISRYELAHIASGLARHFCLEPHARVPLHLEDVPVDHWARPQVEYACSTGILNTRGVGKLAIHEEQAAYKSEHIGRVRRRRSTMHGSFEAEFAPEPPNASIPR